MIQVFFSKIFGQQQQQEDVLVECFAYDEEPFIFKTEKDWKTHNWSDYIKKRDKAMGFVDNTPGAYIVETTDIDQNNYYHEFTKFCVYKKINQKI